MYIQGCKIAALLNFLKHYSFSISTEPIYCRERKEKMIKICPYCGDYFSDKLLEMHMSVCTKKQEVEAGMYICPECGEQFTEKTAFIAHKDMHKQKEPVK